MINITLNIKSSNNTNNETHSGNTGDCFYFIYIQNKIYNLLPISNKQITWW